VRAGGGRGGPEVEELRTAFNTMLEHIDDALAVRTEAEQRLRRFVADASHELRTPLMSVRGYADLFQYAAANAPEEHEKHLARLRAEAARTGVLLDDLLLLAGRTPPRRRHRCGWRTRTWPNWCGRPRTPSAPGEGSTCCP
jgi:two-component system OmpR family sensor kinase